MHNSRLSRFTTLTLAAGLVFCSFQASPEDIDIFSVDESGIVAKPNVLIVLDNTANWSAVDQHWEPKGTTQGEAEANAFIALVNDPIIGADVNIGLMEYISQGTGSEPDYGYVRVHIRPMLPANKARFAAEAKEIHDGINTPVEKRNALPPFGNLMHDVYNYLAGAKQANNGAGTDAAYADADAYKSGTVPAFSQFQSPLTSADTCTRTVVIFIGNAGTLQADSHDDVDGDLKTFEDAKPLVYDNRSALYNLAKAAGGASAALRAIIPLALPEYTVASTTETDRIGYSEACYDSVADCTANLLDRDVNENNIKDCDEGYDSCVCDATDFRSCGAATAWDVVGRYTEKSPPETLPGYPETQPSESNVDTGDIVQVCKTSGQGTALNPTFCPTTPDSTVPGPDANQTTTTATAWSNCQYKPIGGTGCTGGKLNYQKQGTRTQTITVKEIKDIPKEDPLGASPRCYESEAACDGEAGGVVCDPAKYPDGCDCTASLGAGSCPSASVNVFQETGDFTFITATQTGRSRPEPKFLLLDEWARFLRQTGVEVPDAGGARTKVTTYTIDVFKDQPNADFSALLFNTARVGGGKYFQAKNEDALLRALKQILTEVQAVNSAFSSASLPVNATNRAQNQNQVFIGVFKPDRGKKPGWFGNLKQYKLITSGAAIELGDRNGNPAVNEQTGFITDCAESFWTTDSVLRPSYLPGPVAYWEPVTRTEDLTTNCSGVAFPLSDLPDGQFVEKGAAAEVLRKGNDPAAVPDDDGNYVLNRKVYTKDDTTTAGAEPADFDLSNANIVLDKHVLLHARGEDINDDDNDDGFALLGGERTEPRATIHGDVVHSRPQPVNYGGDTEVVVYYGGNDGPYRAVLAKTGQELWSFVAPEHYDKLQRLDDNSPDIQYSGAVLDPVLRPKDYFFDGSTGVYQTFKVLLDADSKPVLDAKGKEISVSDVTYIYPSMRRGGAKVYALDVSTPATPKYLWSKGCSVDYKTGAYSGCDTDFEAIGQTWSLPNVATIKGYCGSADPTCAGGKPQPVVVFGGGYDTCDDQDTPFPCTAIRGQGVYVVDAVTGEQLTYIDFKSSPNARGIAADVALIDVDNDSFVDYGYAVDTGGNVYRVDFVDKDRKALAKDKWTGARIAYTNVADGEDDDPRKFLFAPALVQVAANIVYLAVGTGDREHPLMGHYPFGDLKDPPSAILNRFYVFKNALSDVATTALDLDFVDPKGMADYTSLDACDTPRVLPGSDLKGWFINLNAEGQGEQVVTSAIIATGSVNFSTNRPNPDEDEDDTKAVCTTSLGEARGYDLNLFNASGGVGVAGSCGGSRSSTFVGGGLPPSPVLATVPIDGQVYTVCIGCVQKTGEPSSAIEASRRIPDIPSHRKPIYWFKSTGDK